MTELAISLDLHSKTPLYEQIYDYIREEIRRRQILPGERLPSSRALSSYLQVSRSTVELAYEQLVSEGYLESVPYRGYFVCEMEELYHIEGMESAEQTFQEEKKPEWRWDFAVSGIAPGGFPYNAWKKISREVLNDASPELFQLGDPQGEPGLREAIANYLHLARGVNCSPSQIIVGAGNDYLLMLLSVLFGEKKKIAMENPTYRSAFCCFESLGHEICPVPMDEAGMDRKALEASGAQIAYVMPAHQFPVGTVMPVKRRLSLLAWAVREEGRYLLEDDYDSEFRYKGKPIPALQGFDSAQRVIYLGTFSRAIAPSIRVSYMVLPESLMPVYRSKGKNFSATVSRTDQKILEVFMRDGYFERHLNRMRALYKTKHDLLLRQLRAFQDICTVSGEHAGVHVLLKLTNGLSAEQAARLAAEAGVKVYRLKDYYIGETGGKDDTVMIGYASMPEEEIPEACEVLLNAWKDAVKQEGRKSRKE